MSNGMHQVGRQEEGMKSQECLHFRSSHLACGCENILCHDPQVDISSISLSTKHSLSNVTACKGTLSNAHVSALRNMCTATDVALCPARRVAAQRQPTCWLCTRSHMQSCIKSCTYLCIRSYQRLLVLSSFWFFLKALQPALLTYWLSQPGHTSIGLYRIERKIYLISEFVWTAHLFPDRLCSKFVPESRDITSLSLCKNLHRPSVEIEVIQSFESHRPTGF